jgi:acetolactate synthase-1/2/3 large subunit
VPNWPHLTGLVFRFAVTARSLCMPMFWEQRLNIIFQVVWVVWNNYAYGSIRGLQRGYLGNRELATDFHHPDTGLPYNPDFAAMARSAGVEGVSIDRAGDLGDAILAGIKSNRPYLIDANISGDLNPPGAGVWEIPSLGVNKPAIGERYIPK